MTEAQHIAAIEHDLQQAVNGRGRAFIDDIDAAVLLKELARLRSQAMDFADVVNQLSEHMGRFTHSWAIKSLASFPNLKGYQKQETEMKMLPTEYVRQHGDCDYGFYGDSYFPTTYPDGDGGVLYLHVSWTE